MLVQVWAGALLLCEFIDATHRSGDRCFRADGECNGFRGLRVIELGAGCGLCGMCCAKVLVCCCSSCSLDVRQLGADTVLTDLAMTVDLLR